ncbi:MAG: hydroxyphenylacetyl-CoA thioesterase PaaI [Bacteroidetes bacterium]|nr:hydroxyphenylacetyl-CoA thioesterase PaaI [Bacteroidota bacterium]MBS1973047.1 hydroxyphenylacetyl-CoA thioesterase PaaI [Bacteroidota bacterium]
MNSPDNLAKRAVEKMMAHDYFSQWLKVEIMEVKQYYSKIKMELRREMLNGFGIAHGGITFALADSAFAFACNSDGKITVALDNSISFTKPGREGDTLTAEAKQISRANKTALYLIEVKNQNNELVALFKGTCYRTEKSLF